MHYNGENSYLFVNGKETHKVKAKDSEIVATSLSLEHVSKNWSIDNMRTTRLSGFAYDFSVDYNAIAVHDILDIYNYLMKKYNKMFGFTKKCFLAGLVLLSTLTSENLLSCILMNNQECKVRPQIVNLNGDDLVSFPFSVKTNKCGGSFHNISNL